MEEQVLSIEEMKHLEELGLDTSNAKLWWIKNICDGRGRREKKYLIPTFLSLHKEMQTVGLTFFKRIPTYTLYDVLKMLPSIVDNYKVYVPIVGGCSCSYINANGDIHNYEIYKSITRKTDKEALYDMLCWCLENNHIKPTK